MPEPNPPENHPPGDGASPQPKILAQIVEEPDGGIVVVSGLPGPKAFEILISMLKPTYDAVVQQVKDKKQIVRPGAGIVNRIRSLHK